MQRLDRRIARFEIKGGEAGDGSTFEGWAAVFNNLDHKGDIIAPGAFSQDIAFTRAEGKIRDEHCNTTGRIAEADEQGQGLFIKGLISATAAGNDQRTLVKDGVIKRLSIGFCALGREWLNTPDEVKAYWQGVGYTPSEDDILNLGSFGCARLVKRAKVYEVSTTWLPVNDKAAITSVKSLGPRAGASFDEHASRVLATVEEFAERAGSAKKLRAEDGRQLSTKSLALIGRLAGRLSELAAATEPQAEAKADDDLALFDRYLQMGERLRGAD